MGCPSGHEVFGSLQDSRGVPRLKGCSDRSHLHGFSSLAWLHRAWGFGSLTFACLNLIGMAISSCIGYPLSHGISVLALLFLGVKFVKKKARLPGMVPPRYTNLLRPVCAPPTRRGPATAAGRVPPDPGTGPRTVARHKPGASAAACRRAARLRPPSLACDLVEHRPAVSLPAVQALPTT
jgi:hypothetical protein